jgi:glycosyltransferase involved in cell wall biosynthesis
MGSVAFQEPDIIDTLWQRNRFDRVFDRTAPCLKIWHQFDLLQRIGSGPYFAYPFFEVTPLRPHEQNHLSIPDHVFVSCKWAQDQLDSSISSSIVHPGVDRKIFYEREKIVDGPYTFINVGKWEKRKGHDLLPKLFDKAFAKKDDVRLVIAPNGYDIPQEEVNSWYSRYGQMALKDKVVITGRLKDHTAVADLMRSAHCGLFVSRAEGWNLELVECMSVGLPVITTWVTAMSEYCNNENSIGIGSDPPDKLEKAFDNKYFHGEGYWLDFDQNAEDECIEMMRYAYKSRLNENQGGIETAKRLSWTNTVDQLLQTINGDFKWNITY